MSLLLTLVRTPRPQPVRQMRLDDGELVIGRGAEADWRIDDPDQYVSRAHCTVSGRSGAFSVTDTSSGGLFVDDGRSPLGAGRSAALSDGTRLRLGDYVIEVEVESTEAAPIRARPESRPERQPERQPARGPEFDADGFFATPVVEPPRPERPSDLPDPFEQTPGFAAEAAPERRGPPAFDDPFTLDPADTSRLRERPAPASFDWGTPAPPATPAPPPAEGFGWGEPEPAPAPPAPPAPPAAPRPAAAAPPGAPDDAAAVAAFLRGLGLDPADAPGDAAARMEAFGREYRMMAEGLMRLLRMRAEEKGNARIAQTVMSSRVNPLKFMPTVDDALAVLMAPPSSGFTDAETSIAGAVRDLAAHQVNTWRGIQAALRRMIDRFSPAALEKELEALGLLETAPGRRPPRQALGTLREAVPRDRPERGDALPGRGRGGFPRRLRNRGEVSHVDAMLNRRAFLATSAAAALLAACGGPPEAGVRHRRGHRRRRHEPRPGRGGPAGHPLDPAAEGRRQPSTPPTISPCRRTRRPRSVPISSAWTRSR